MNGDSQWSKQVACFAPANQVLLAINHNNSVGAQWLSGRVLDSRPKGRGFEPHRRHCVVSLSKNIYPSLVLVQPRKTRPFITERLLMGRKESNQTKTTTVWLTTTVYGKCSKISNTLKLRTPKIITENNF